MMYIFLFAVTMLTPIIMISFGLLWKHNPPKTTNGIYGYRTNMSMKNKSTWNFAHKYHANIWFWSGVILAVFSLMGLILFKENKNFEYYDLIIISTQIVTMIFSIIPTEYALRKKFNKDVSLK